MLFVVDRSAIKTSLQNIPSKHPFKTSPQNFSTKTTHNAKSFNRPTLLPSPLWGEGQDPACVSITLHSVMPKAETPTTAPIQSRH